MIYRIRVIRIPPELTCFFKCDGDRLRLDVSVILNACYGGALGFFPLSSSSQKKRKKVPLGLFSTLDYIVAAARKERRKPKQQQEQRSSNEVKREEEGEGKLQQKSLPSFDKPFPPSLLLLHLTVDWPLFSLGEGEAVASIHQRRNNKAAGETAAPDPKPPPPATTTLSFSVISIRGWCLLMKTNDCLSPFLFSFPKKKKKKLQHATTFPFFFLTRAHTSMRQQRHC